MSQIDDEAQRWALLGADRDLDPAEQAKLDGWLAADSRHRGAYARALAIHNALSRVAAQENLRPQAVAAVSPPLARWTGRRRALALGAVAASMAVIGYPVFRLAGSEGTMLATSRGEFRRVPLPDRSIASIAGSSRIEIRFTRQAREILVHEGEAWFEVAGDVSRPFLARVNGVQARAVGTAFGVRHENGGAEVFVTHGVVSVSNDAAATAQLQAGEQAFVAERGSKIGIDRNPAEVQRRLAWREGNLVFMNQPLEDAVADFNRYGSRTIVIADRRIARQPLVGRYRIDAPERFARDVAAFLAVPVAISAKEIRIG